MRRRSSIRWAMRWVMLAVCGGLLVALAQPAGADVTVGLFAPAAPLQDTQARVALAAALAEHLHRELPEQKVRSRVFAHLEDFKAAVRDRRITVALVDPWSLRVPLPTQRVVAVTQSLAPWLLVANDSLSMASLRNTHLLVATGENGPATRSGATSSEVVSDDTAAKIAEALLQGEATTFFKVISARPDSASALTSLVLGQADCVLLPAGLPLPDRVSVVRTLSPGVPALALVVYGNAGEPTLLDRVAAAAVKFHDASIDGFTPIDADALAALRQRFVTEPRMGPMMMLSARALIRDLAMQPSEVIETRSALHWVTGPLSPLVPPAVPAPVEPPPPPSVSAESGRP